VAAILTHYFCASFAVLHHRINSNYENACDLGCVTLGKDLSTDLVHWKAMPQEATTGIWWSHI
jgi:hypothetical protein